jgi:hypothetical protein
MFNQIYSYLGLELQSNYEKYEKNIKTTKLAMELKLSRKQHAFIPYSPKNQYSIIISRLAKNDHLKIVL